MNIVIKKSRTAGNYLLLVLQISRIDHSDVASCWKRFTLVSRRRDGGRFHQVFNSAVVKASSTQAAGTRGRDWLLATRTLLRHPPFLFPPRYPWINYARYLHTKRPRKIKNTNSECGRYPPVAPPRSSSPSHSRSSCRTFSRAREELPLFFSPALFPSARFGHILSRRFPRSGSDAIAL